ncbi:MAG: NYN domain-containing protein [Nanoarchaeota archaeon]
MESILLFIDAGYLSHISKHFGRNKPLRYKIENFAVNLCKYLNLDCKEIYFYIAPPFQSPKPTEEENNRKANYDKFISKLKKVSPKINIREGRLQKIDNIFTQKGVDTLMTMDLLNVSQKRETKNVVIITSDTDFVPIIKHVKQDYGITVILAYFTDRKRKSAFSMSNHLWKAVDKKILIKPEFFS